MVIKILQIILAAFIGLDGIIKVLRLDFQVEHWKEYQYPMWFLTVTGIMEIIAAAAIIIGFWNRNFAIIGSSIVVVFMVGAIYTHIFRVEQPLTTAIPSTICLLLAIILIVRYYNN
jgi:uncharacterized membrane protein YphA (DoxX/SURF4 family)